MTENVYHIYLKKECIYHSLNEEEFIKTWDMIQKFLSVHDAQIDKNDIQYEEVSVDKITSCLQPSY
jgi:hypothetical protein